MAPGFVFYFQTKQIFLLQSEQHCYADENLSYISKSMISGIRTIQNDFNVAEEMLYLIPLQATTKSMDIFESIKMGLSD